MACGAFSSRPGLVVDYIEKKVLEGEKKGE